MVQRTRNSQVVMGALAGVTGLTIALYVFNTLLKVTLPNLYTCAGNGTYYNKTTCCVASSNCVSNTNTSASVLGYFGQAANFVQDILPVAGIIGVYLIMKVTIKRMTY